MLDLHLPGIARAMERMIEAIEAVTLELAQLRKCIEAIGSEAGGKKK